MKILITGAGGFVGKSLAQAAEEQGHEVTGVIRSTPNPAMREEQLIQADLSQAISSSSPLAEALSQTEVVIHTAGRIRGSSRKEFTRDNVDATRAILEAADRAGVKRFVHVGSTAVYGDRAPEQGIVDEDSPLGYRVSRLDHYSLSKIEAERLVLSAMSTGDTEVVSLRPGWIIGAGDGTLRELAGRLDGGVFPLVGMGHNRLPVTSIGSVTAGLLLAATEDAAAGRIYNVAQDEEMSQRVFFAALARAANVRSRMIPVPATLLDKAGLIAEIIGNILPGFQPPLSRNVVALLGLDAQFPTSRIREELGWLPAAPIPDVLRDALL